MESWDVNMKSLMDELLINLSFDDEMTYLIFNILAVTRCIQYSIGKGSKVSIRN